VVNSHLRGRAAGPPVNNQFFLCVLRQEADNRFGRSKKIARLWGSLLGGSRSASLHSPHSSVTAGDVSLRPIKAFYKRFLKNGHMELNLS